MVPRKLFYEPSFHKDLVWEEGYTAGDGLETIKTYWLSAGDKSRPWRCVAVWKYY